MRETTRRLGICRATVLKLVTRGELPMRRVGNTWKVSRAALDRFIDGTVAPSWREPFDRELSRRLEALDAERAEILEQLTGGGR
jgi:excisionase family DNA binding protein